jgi:hypothetical protein
VVQEQAQIAAEQAASRLNDDLPVKAEALTVEDWNNS